LSLKHLYYIAFLGQKVASCKLEIPIVFKMESQNQKLDGFKLNNY